MPQINDNSLSGAGNGGSAVRGHVCPDNFKNARQFAAYAGFAPTHTGTGCKVVMGGIPLKGNPVLKRVLYQACLAMYSRNKRLKHQPEENKDTWLARLSRRQPVKKTVCAAADKICRIS